MASDDNEKNNEIVLVSIKIDYFLNILTIITNKITRILHHTWKPLCSLT